MADPTKVVVEIDLAGLVLADGGETLGDLVVRLAAAQLLDARRDRWYDDLVAHVRGIRDEQIVEVLRPMIEEAMGRAVQPTDHFGEAKGPPTTLHEVIVAQVTAALRVTHRSGPGATREQLSLLEEVVREQVRRELAGELKAAVAEGRAQVLAAVKDQAAEVIAETIARRAGA